MTAHFTSAEGVVLSHIKVGGKAVEVLMKVEQLSLVDPSAQPFFVLYHKKDEELKLEKGDRITDTIVFDFPEWTCGKNK